MMISLNVSVMPFINTVVSAVFNLRCLYYLGLMYRPLLGSIDTPWPEVEAFYRSGVISNIGEYTMLMTSIIQK